MAHLVANYIRWNPVGAIRAGRNPATYKDHGETVHIDHIINNFHYLCMMHKEKAYVP
jgi:hypothetical protein